MKHIKINVKETIKQILPEYLEKDLLYNEKICPICCGLGYVIDNNRYGIKGDVSDTAKISMFPYNHQSIKFCPNCFNGVIKVCEYCGKQIQRSSIDSCNCDQYKAKQELKKRIKYRAKINKATEIKLKEVNNADTYFYDDKTDDYFATIVDFVDAYKYMEDFESDEDMMNNLPEVLWFCNSKDIYIDANSIVEQACEDLHEDAFENIFETDLKELQNILNEWCKKQTGTRTLFPDYSRYVKVDKNWFI